MPGFQQNILARHCPPEHLTFPRQGGVAVRLCQAWERVLPRLSRWGEGRLVSHSRLVRMSEESEFPDMLTNSSGCHALSREGRLELRLVALQDVLVLERAQSRWEVQFRDAQGPVICWHPRQEMQSGHGVELARVLAQGQSVCLRCPHSQDSCASDAGNLYEKRRRHSQAGAIPVASPQEVVYRTARAVEAGLRLRATLITSTLRHVLEFGPGSFVSTESTQLRVQDRYRELEMHRKVADGAPLFFQESGPMGWKAMWCHPEWMEFFTLEARPPLPGATRFRNRTPTRR